METTNHPAKSQVLEKWGIQPTALLSVPLPSFREQLLSHCGFQWLEVENKKKLTWIHTIRGVGGSRGGALQDKTAELWWNSVGPAELSWIPVWLLTQHWALAKSLGHCSTLGSSQSQCPPAWESLTAAGSTSRPEGWIQVHSWRASPQLGAKLKGSCSALPRSQEIALSFVSNVVVGNGEQRGSAEAVLGGAAVPLHCAPQSSFRDCTELEQNRKVSSYVYSLLPLRSIWSKDLLKWQPLTHLCCLPCHQKLLSFI